MNALRNLWNAFANLANAINGLALVVDTASGRLRQSLALDGVEVLEHTPDTTGPDGSADEPAPSVRRGKAKVSA